ncbi:MAG: hypothetical protein ABIA59_07865 [Candidatus Latescibacterota bacterium]
MRARKVLAILSILTVALLSGQCGKDENPTQTTIITDPVDTIPPAAISDLLTKNPASNSLFLLWTAPGDDGSDGTADSYDVRYYHEQISFWDGLQRHLGDTESHGLCRGGAGDSIPSPRGGIGEYQLEPLRHNGL